MEAIMATATLTMDRKIATHVEDLIRDWEGRSLTELLTLLNSAEAPRINWEAVGALVGTPLAWEVLAWLRSVDSEDAYEAADYLEAMLGDQEAMARLKRLVAPLSHWEADSLTLHYCCVEPGELAYWLESYNDAQALVEYAEGTFDDCLGRVQTHRY